MSFLMAEEYSIVYRDHIFFIHSFGEYKKIVKGNRGERRKSEWEISERETEYERLLALETN